MAKSERIVIAANGGWKSPSARIRLGPLAQEEEGRMHSVAQYPTRDQVDLLAAEGTEDTVLILQRVLPGQDQLDRLKALYQATIFDMDDAIFATPRDPRGLGWVEWVKRVGRT